MKRLRRGGFLISRVHRSAGRIFAKKLKEYDLDSINPAQGRILFALWEKDGITIQELAKKTSLGKSTLTGMLDRLEDAGHLKRVPSRKDRRKIIIRLGEKDRKLRDVYHAVSADMSRLFYRDFSKSEIESFERALERILHNLETRENV